MCFGVCLFPSYVPYLPACHTTLPACVLSVQSLTLPLCLPPCFQTERQKTLMPKTFVQCWPYSEAIHFFFLHFFFMTFKGIVHPKKKMLSTFTCSKQAWLFCLLWNIKKCILINASGFLLPHKGQWKSVTQTISLPTFFKIYTFVFHRGKSHRFETACGWVNKDIIKFFGVSYAFILTVCVCVCCNSVISCGSCVCVCVAIL